MKKPTKTVKLIIAEAVAVAVLIVSSVAFPVCLSSTQSYVQGVTRYGAVAVGSADTVELKKEIVTFDTSAYNVTAEYEFYNSGTEARTVKLAVPCDMDQVVSVTVDEKKVKTAARYTYAGADAAENFDIGKEVTKLRDGYRDCGFITPDTLVTRYRFRVTVTDKTRTQAYADFTVGDRESMLYCMSDVRGRTEVGNGYKIGKQVSSGDTFTVWVIGTPLNSFPQWGLYSGSNRKKTVDGMVTTTRVDSFSFTEYVAMQFVSYEAKDAGVPFADYYNAVLDKLDGNSCKDYGYVENTAVGLSELTPWCEYELDIPSKTNLTNLVTTRIVPSVDRTFNPEVNVFTYKPTAVTNVKNFDRLYVHVYTPHRIVSGNLAEDVKKYYKNDYYTAIYGGIPNELRLGVCTSENPKRGGRLAQSAGACVALGFLFFAAVACIIVGTLLICETVRVRRQAKRQPLSTPDA